MHSDAEILEMAKDQGLWALEKATDAQRDDDEIVRAAVESAGYALEHASERLRDEETIVRAAVKDDGNALEYASERLRDRETIVQAAVEAAGWALEYASERLRDRETIVRAALADTGTNALKFASARLRDDKSIVREALETDGYDIIKHASLRLRDDEAFMREAMEQVPRGQDYTLEYASERLCDNQEFVSAAIRKNYLSIQYASPRLQTEPSVVLALVERVLEQGAFTKKRTPRRHSRAVEGALLNLLKKNAKALAEARSQLNREVIDVDSGETTYEPAPKRARTERAADEPPPRSGLALAAEATTSAKEIKIELTTQRDAERRRADDLAERNECCVCMEADAAVCFLPCRHLSTCEACAAPLESCPTCRVPIQRRIVVFRN
jgi:hypothetical protein